MQALRSQVAVGRPGSRGEGSTPMADLAYAVLLIVIFAILALTLRGLERL
jgi:hypothetical protein